MRQILKEPQKYAATIIALASDESAPNSVRSLMIRLLGGLTDGESLQALLDISGRPGEVTLRPESLKALAGRQEKAAEARLREIASDASDPGQAMAMSLLGTSHSQESRSALLSQARRNDPDNNEQLRNAALYSLRRYGDSEAVQVLMQTASDVSEPARIRATALYSLGVIGDASALSIVKESLASADREVRYSAALASVRISDQDITAGLVQQLCDAANYLHVRKAASMGLAKNASATDLAALRQALPTCDGFGLILAADIFAARNDRGSLGVLQNLVRDNSDGYVVAKVQEAIDRIDGGRK
jgi:HEAT repeat protein